jgi:processive 1,2-diacylglycerol beta-glucosyltransferase
MPPTYPTALEPAKLVKSSLDQLIVNELECSVVSWHGATRPLRVLIVSATVGAGDAGNARELARRLGNLGHEVEIKDFLDATPFGMGKVLTRGYEAELRHAPWAYELAFRVWFWFPFLLAPLSRLLSFGTRRGILRWVRQVRADVVVSTYPVATQVLGDMRCRAKARARLTMRKRGALRVPAVNVITDFGFHPFWAHRGIDLNMAVHPSTVKAVARRTGQPSVTCSPLVGPEFAAAQARRARQRADLGLHKSELAILISSGSWGVGAVRETFELVATRPGLVPVVACGHNEDLRRQLEDLAKAKGYRVVVLGWSDDMAGVMAACDVLVENAGGLTSLEAMSAGVPLVSFRPIPGHGRNSAAAMSAAGVSCWAGNSEGLLENLVLLGRPGLARYRQLSAVAELFSEDAATAVSQLAVSGEPPQPRLRPVARLARAASTVALAGALAWVGLTTGVGVAAAAGAGVAHPPPGAGNVVYLGVRLSPQELASREVQTALLDLHSSAVVDANSAEADGRAVRALAAKGLDVESGGLGGSAGDPNGPRAPWALALSDTQSAQQLSAICGRTVGVLVPDRSISIFDLVDTSSAHLMMVIPNATLPITAGGPFPRQVLAVPQLQPGQIYVVEGLKVTPVDLVDLLGNIRAQLSVDGLVSAPFSRLQ